MSPCEQPADVMRPCHDCQSQASLWANIISNAQLRRANFLDRIALMNHNVTRITGGKP